ncbi:MAG: ATP-binding cassette domain-containing protein [Spirochaetaceae bacterium]|nr:MAG: ATP-binding cassette domain-containing protein [Spirochaetaceae bacterium]
MHKPSGLIRSVMPLLGVVSALLVWALLAQIVGRTILLPGPVATLASLIEIVRAPGFATVVAATVGRWGIALCLALPVAVLTGGAAGLSRIGAEFLRPLVSAARATPVISVILIALIWLPIPQVPVLVGFVVAYPLLHQGIADGLRSIDPELRELSRAYRWGAFRRVVHLEIPGSLPTVVSALAGALGMSWKAVLAAEVLSLPAFGIGSMLQDSRIYLDTAAVLAWTLIAVLAAYGFDQLLSLLLPVEGRRARRSWYGRMGLWVTSFPARRATAKPPTVAQPSPAELIFQDVSFGFAGEEILRSFNLTVKPGEVCALLGPSGCGKTTLIRLASGLLRPNSGAILLDVQEPRRVRPAPAVAFQDPRLLPWEPARVQVSLGMPGLLAHRAAGRVHVDRLLLELGLAHATERYPDELSGGMKKRLNVARAVAHPSGLLLLDEPFSHQDPTTHAELLAFASGLFQHDPRTVLLVTHDPHEALTLADRVVVLSSDKPLRVVADSPTNELNSTQLLQLYSLTALGNK